MNYIAAEIYSIINGEHDDELTHYGKGHLDGGHSGRYPWGSGESPFQHTKLFMQYVDELRKSGAKWIDDETGKVYTGDTAIAKSLNMSTGDFRALYTLTNNDIKLDKYAKALKLRDEGYTNAQIAKELGLPNESTVRTWFTNQNFEAGLSKAKNTAQMIAEEIEKNGMIDVGSSEAYRLGISEKTLNDALVYLKMQGYEVYGGRVPQATNPGKMTTLRVVCPPGTPNSDIYKFDQIHQINEKISYDDGQTFKPSFQFPASLDPSRLGVKYAEEGGLAKDGVVELRRGVDDLYLGDGVNYAQVRILVDGTHYIKGMAVYGDDLPDGVDVLVNSNKPIGTPIFGKGDKSVLKKAKTKINPETGEEEIDRENPFKSLIKPMEEGGQMEYMGEDGKMHLSLINKRADEGDWSEWSKKVPAQFLSKQPVALIKQQLKVTLDDKQAELDEIMAIDNPTIKRYLLNSFALDCDKSAVDLKAAALPGQQYEVILPVNSLKDNECYAPNYENGTKLALIRFPHSGTFEIPIVTVNNKNEEAQRVFGKNPKDVVGINKYNADRLSGADFDGDTVMSIPVTEHTPIKSTKLFEELEGFDDKAAYPGYTGMKVMSDTQKQMGVISNLISDMTLFGADDREMAKAVKHSMVVIDAEKHELDWRKSEKDNDISTLKKKYQGHVDPETGKIIGGASTLISRAGADVRIPKRVGSPIVNPDGSLSYKTASDKDLYYTQIYDKTTKKWKSTYKKADGLYTKDSETGEYRKINASDKTRVQMRTEISTQMAETSDARTLISSRNTVQERAYADYANKMKTYANNARKTAKFEVGKLEYNPSAAKTYNNEVESLNSKYNNAVANQSKERRAQLLAAAEVSKAKKIEPNMSKKDLQKANQRAITKARAAVGLEKREDRQINITDKEWEAIQNGAISDSKLDKMLKYTDLDDLRSRATPRSNNGISDTKIGRIKALAAGGYTQAEIANRLGISASTVSKYI